EPLRISLRLTPAGGQENMRPGSQYPTTTASQPIGSARAAAQVAATKGGNGGEANSPKGTVSNRLADDKLVFNLRPDPSGRAYWLDIDISAIPETGAFSYSKLIAGGAEKLVELPIEMTLSVVKDDFVVGPTPLNVDGITIPKDPAVAVDIGRFEIRRTVRPFQVKSASCSLPFVKTEIATLVPKKRYVVKLKLTGGSVLVPGLHKGSITILTDDKSNPVIEVPLSIGLVR
ncbi:MAG TPA: hypothetical protein VI756_06740, partial [Blastocatellia bacterium]